MGQVDYQQRVRECAKQAESAPNLQARVIWKRMEAFWRNMALRPKVEQAKKPMSFISSAP